MIFNGIIVACIYGVFSHFGRLCKYFLSIEVNIVWPTSLVVPLPKKKTIKTKFLCSIIESSSPISNDFTSLCWCNEKYEYYELKLQCYRQIMIKS